MNNEHALVSCRHGESAARSLPMQSRTSERHTPLTSGGARERSRRLVAITLLLLGADPAIAQETRAETIREQQADKQSVVAPPSANRAEVIIDRLEDWGFFTGEPRGFYPWLGSVFPGGGVAAGAGVRKPFGDDGAINVFGGYSIDGFWRADANVELPTFVQNRARVTLSGRYTDAPDVRFYGIGNDTLKDDQTHYGYTPAGGGARLDFEAVKYLSLGGGVNYLDIETSAGRTGLSIEQRFSPADTPGLDFDKLQLHQQHRARNVRLAPASGLLGLGWPVSRPVR